MYIFLLVVLGAVTVFCIGKSIYYKKHIQSIEKQLKFLSEYETNKIVTAESGNAAVRKLIDRVNGLISRTQELKKEYLRQENTLKETITSLSHDIRTPLTSLDGYFQLLSQTEDSEEQRHYISIIENRIVSLKEMLDELFTYAKLQNSSYEIPLEECAINEILLSTVFGFYDNFTANHITLNLEVGEKGVTVRANRGALERIFQNIMKNFLEYAYEEGRIQLQEKENQVTLVFANKLRENSLQVDKVFDRFYRTDNARSRNSTGLGLSIVKELVVRMGGEIQANKIDEQFVLTIAFPKY